MNYWNYTEILRASFIHLLYWFELTEHDRILIFPIFILCAKLISNTRVSQFLLKKKKPDLSDGQINNTETIYATIFNTNLADKIFNSA